MHPSIADDRLADAIQVGVIGSVSARVQRDLQDRAAAYPDLFPPGPFDTTFFSTLALANAYAAPWLDAEGLRPTARMGLWNFAVDSRIDHAETSISKSRQIAQEVLYAAVDTPPVDADPAARLLADIRCELSTAPAFAALAATWQAELRRMLSAMVQESEWRHAGHGATAPALGEYLQTAADSIGLSAVLVTHWIATCESKTPGPVETVLASARGAERLLRLLNDLATVDRDLRTGDLNALTLGASRDAVHAEIVSIVGHGEELTAPIAAREPKLAEFLQRQIGFNLGLYRFTDYRGRE